MPPSPQAASPGVRRSVGTLLLQQERAGIEIRRAVNAQIAIAAAEAEKRRADERDAVLLALLLSAGNRMQTVVAASVLEARQEARDAGRRRLATELKAAGVVLAAHQWSLRDRSDEDAGFADHAADSLAAQWRGLAVAAVLGASANDLSPGDAIRSTRRPMSLRVTRTAETETARAYSDEHGAALADVIQHDRGYRDGELADYLEATTMRQWSALADACERCWPLDGVTVGLLEPFPGGYLPGGVHPRCRCIEVLVSRATETRVAA